VVPVSNPGVICLRRAHFFSRHGGGNCIIETTVKFLLSHSLIDRLLGVDKRHTISLCYRNTLVSATLFITVSLSVDMRIFTLNLYQMNKTFG